MINGITRSTALRTTSVEYVEQQLPKQLANSCGGGTLVVVGRTLSELKFLALLIVSAVVQTSKGRESADAVHCDRETAVACAAAHVDTTDQQCVDRLVCIAEKQAALAPTLGLRLSDRVEQGLLVLIALLLLLNLAFVVRSIRQALTDHEFLKEWRQHNYADVRDHDGN